MSEGRPVFEEMAEEECRALLAGHHVGRLAAVVDGQLEIFPMNYAYSDGAVVFRTDPGTKLDGAGFGRVVFEIDGVDDAGRTGWSVIMRGVSTEINEALDPASADLRHLDVQPWAPGPKARWVALRAETITGRRIRRA